MPKYTQHLLDKENKKLAASIQRPQSPDYASSVKIGKTLSDIDKPYDDAINKEKNRADAELKERWSKKGGGNIEDDILTGFISGMKQGSILDDKKRTKGFKEGLEKMKTMVDGQNMELARQQRLFDAKESIMPNWMAYSQRAQSMDPANREQAVDSMLQRYNSVAGTSYQRGPVDAREPWKITVMDDEGAQVIDMMDLMKTPTERRMEIMMNSPEYQRAEGFARQEFNTDQALKQSILQQRQGGDKNLGQAESQQAQFFTTPSGKQIDVSKYPTLETTAERNRYSKTFTGMSKIEREMQDTLKDVLELKSMTKGNMFSPVGSQLGESPNKLKDWISKGSKVDNEITKEVVLRNKVESRFQQLQPVIEQHLKGAAPDSQLLKRMHDKGVYPETNQSFPVIEAKLKMLIDTAKEERDLADASLRTGRQIPFFEDRSLGLHKNNMGQKKFKLPNGVTPTPEEIEQLRADGIDIS